MKGGDKNIRAGRALTFARIMSSQNNDKESFLVRASEIFGLEDLATAFEDLGFKTETIDKPPSLRVWRNHAAL